MNYPAEVGKEISFVLHNYKSIDKLIEQRREELLGTLNDGKDSWMKSKTQIYGHTIEDIIIRIDEDDRISRLLSWKKLLDNFFFNLYINDDYVLSSFCKLKYLQDKNDEQIHIALDLNSDEIKYLDVKIKSFIYDKAKRLYLYDETEVNKSASK
jgi:hypothetical protein